MAHHHHLPGMHNLRDLGGFVTATGAVTRPGVFWRGDSPHRVNTTDIGYFATNHITTVIDLRHSHEQQIAPNPLANQPDIHYVAMPLFQVSHQNNNAMTRLDSF